MIKTGDYDIENPYVSDDLIDYLNKRFDMHYCLSQGDKGKDASETVGFMKGVMEVIDHLSILNEEQKGE